MKKKLKPILFALLALVLTCSIAAGGWYWYDNHIDRSGWAERDGVAYYRDFHGRPVSGWAELPEGRFYLSRDGVPKTGWQEIGDQIYHFEPTGLIHTGLLQWEGRSYYFGSDGAMVTGWQTLGDEKHYFGADGAMVSGWLTLEDGTYYLPKSTLATGWQNIEEQTYYFDEAGRMVTGQAEIDEMRYLFQANGVLLSGWVDREAGRSYYLSNGFPLTGWQEIDGKLYCFDSDGVTAVGWVQEGEYRRYFFADGSAAIGPADIDGQRHYFSPGGLEVLLVNAKNPIPPDYDPQLIDVNENHKVAAPCFESLMAMIAGCEEAGIAFEFNSSYRTQAYQTAILEGYTAGYVEKGLDQDAARARALEFVAYPGTSEHQLGLAVDLLGDEAVKWFNAHCWDYGFIRRYPADKVSYTGIISEPWHFRYVGKEIARELRESGLCLEEYLGAEPVKGS